MFTLLRRTWHRLPIDGSGILSLGPKQLQCFQRSAAREFWRRLPHWSRPPAIFVARLFWLVACPIWVMLEFRKSSARFADLSPALWLGWVRGKHPANTILQRSMARGNNARIRLVPDIPGERQGILLLAALGNRDDIELATDKLAMADRLAKLGLPVPIIRAVILPNQILQMDQLPWTGAEKLLIKPRRGARAQGLLSVHYAGGGLFSINGRVPVDSAQLARRVMAAARWDSLLVQTWVAPSLATRDLSPDAPGVVRAFVTRPGPHEPASVVSAMLKILPPGIDAPHGINELLLIPIAVDEGTLGDGILLDQPGERWARSPWNDAPVRGRPVPYWAEIREMLSRASVTLPGIPVIGWDIVLGQDGPVILEANTGISLFRAMLWHFENQIPSPILATLEAWCLKVVPPGSRPRGIKL
jgi:hypothetical protein